MRPPDATARRPWLRRISARAAPAHLGAGLLRAPSPSAATAHLGPSPGPKSSGRRLGASLPVSLRLS
eukprot:509442-Prymnesium_polylepis.1